MKKFCCFVLFILVLNAPSKAQSTDYAQVNNLHYYPDSINKKDALRNEICVLDIHYPKNVQGFNTIVWFHGGGLTGGKKEIPKALKEKGICVIGVGYRLSPSIKSPKFIQDAAAAVAWAFNNIQKYGGNPSCIFVSGHSAGAYLASMVTLDKQWLDAYAIDANKIAGLIPLSTQAITHFTVRKERGLADTKVVVDSLAPLYFVRKDARVERKDCGFCSSPTRKKSGNCGE